MDPFVMSSNGATPVPVPPPFPDPSDDAARWRTGLHYDLVPVHSGKSVTCCGWQDVPCTGVVSVNSAADPPQKLMLYVLQKGIHQLRDIGRAFNPAHITGTIILYLLVVRRWLARRRSNDQYRRFEPRSAVSARGARFRAVRLQPLVFPPSDPCVP
eukprot:1531952-Rhodomonas_salina.1